MISIRSRLGIHSTLLIASLVIFFSFSASIVYKQIIDANTNGISIEAIIYALPWVIASPLMTIWILTSKIIVSKDKIVSRSLFYNRVIEVSDISEISVPNGLGWLPFSGYNLFLYCEQSRGLSVSNIFFSNSHELTKAIIEAAFNANSRITIDSVLIDAYDFPPYGVFNDEYPRDRKKL